MALNKPLKDPEPGRGAAAPPGNMEYYVYKMAHKRPLKTPNRGKGCGLSFETPPL